MMKLSIRPAEDLGVGVLPALEDRGHATQDLDDTINGGRIHDGDLKGMNLEEVS